MTRPENLLRDAVILRLTGILDRIDSEFKKDPHKQFVFLEKTPDMPWLGSKKGAERLGEFITLYTASGGYYITRKRWEEEYPILLKNIEELSKKSGE